MLSEGRHWIFRKRLRERRQAKRAPDPETIVVWGVKITDLSFEDVCGVVAMLMVPHQELFDEEFGVPLQEESLPVHLLRTVNENDGYTQVIA